MKNLHIRNREYPLASLALLAVNNLGGILLAVVIFCFLALISMGYLFYAVALRYRFTRLGKPENRDDRTGERWKNFFTNIIRQKKVREYPLFGLSHLFIMYGFLVLLVGMPNMVAEGLFHSYIPYLGDNYVFLFVKDIFNGLIILGLCGAVTRRIVRKPEYLKNSFAAFGKLGLILTIVLTEVFFHGARFALGEDLQLRQAAPLALAASQLFANFDVMTIQKSMTMLWWAHFLGVFAFCFMIPHSSHLHLMFAPFNAYWYTLVPKGALRRIRNESGEGFRADKMEDLTWKQLFDAYACVKCGRCNGQCPAFLSGEPLKPKGLNARLRKHIEKRAPLLLKKKAAGTVASEEVAAKPGKAKKGKTAGEGKSLNRLMEAFDQEYIWSCTTCGACMEACPVSTEQPGKLIDLRRHLVLIEGEISEERQRVFDGIAECGNPWGQKQQDGADWAKALSIPTILENPQAEYLYYAGCAATCDETAQKTAAAFVKLLQAAKVNFAVLGGLTWCCGDTARRMGNEVLFDKTAEFNIITWRKLGIKQIITTCPHCFNTLKNEYPQYGGDFTVLHHADFLAGLLREGKLSVNKAFDKAVSFHDPCYLGRYNGGCTEPRAVLQAVPQVRLREMPRAQKHSFCCGAGGGRMWTTPTAHNMITANRTAEAISTGAEVIGTACPFCKKV